MKKCGKAITKRMILYLPYVKQSQKLNGEQTRSVEQ
jgi:hypothetical protein